MTNCQECGQQVAEIDVFCPFCGISLKPIPLAGEAVADEMASTIVIPLPVKPAGNDPSGVSGDSDVTAAESLVTPTSIPTPPTPHVISQLEAQLSTPDLIADTAAKNDDISAPDAREALIAEPDVDPLPRSTETTDAGDGIDNVGRDFEQLRGPQAAIEPEVTIDVIAPDDAPDETIPVSDDNSERSTSDLPPTLEHIHGTDDSVSTPNEPENAIHDSALTATDDETALVAEYEHEPKLAAEEFNIFKEVPAEIPEPIADDPWHAISAETEVAPDASVESPAPHAFDPTMTLDEIPDIDDSAEIESDITTAAEEPTETASPFLATEKAVEAEPTAHEHAEIPPLETSEPVADPHIEKLLSDAYAGAVPLVDEPVAAAPSDIENFAPAVITADPLVEAFGPVSDPSGSGRVSSDSGTTPNIGTGSTDGRKSGLKPLPEGTLLIGRYKITKKIGGGGMGAVYLALDQNLGGTQRAVKEMVQSHIEEEQQAKAIEDFKRESMILSTLDHPSIPTIYDYFYDHEESRFYLVMKYIAGGDLAGQLRSAPEGRIEERTVTEWALQILDVLDYLHSLPTTIVYRDLKPSNVMLDGNTGKVMLIDFGIARSINQTQEKGVTAVGTMGYAPPELFSGQVEPRSDIYSLGSTMFHLLTGADPQNNPLLIFDFQKNPRPRQINPRLSDQMEKILMRAVEYNADARFSSASDMKRAVHEHLDHLAAGMVTYGISETPAAVSLAFQTVFCGFCGQRIVATDMFCAFCGSKQPIGQQGVHSEIYSAPKGNARLVLEGTSDLTAPAYPLDKLENLVGRRDPMSNIFPEVDLSKYDPQTKISRRHARIWRDGTAFLVEDLGSSNGTVLLSRVSDTLRLVPHKAQPIANGDRLRIGDTTLQFIVG